MAGQWQRVGYGAAAWLLAVSAQAQTATNGKIAYTVCDYDPAVGIVCDVWTMNADGTGQTNVTSTPAVSETQPAWSADGARLAYLRDVLGAQVLVVANADGTNAIDVTATPSLQNTPTWSPDGTRIAVSREVPGTTISTQYDIIVITVATGAEVNITGNATGFDFDEREPAWSPDGTKIAFSGVRFEDSVDPVTGDPVTYAQWEVVTVNPDGSGEQILTTGAPGSQRRTHLEEDRAPAWAPDSQSLVYMTQSVEPCCTPWQIERVDRNGTTVTVLSDDPNVYDMFPAFSPDGTLIVFSSSRGGGSDIYTIPATAGTPAAVAAVSAAAATAPARLTLVGNAADPAWAAVPGSTPPPSRTLTVTLDLRDPQAGGLVASLPPGIYCGSDCSETYRRTTTVLLVTAPRWGSKFVGWSGACTGRQLYCVVTVDRAKTAIASFARR